ncbi:MAG: hypothetical protein BGO98_02520 [Myxococcales bacterium 68-20]|nr:hypothetical protein [Myxococcales bacterium]OJY21720.1 MAG: hypothetical protein BGO98_02520 [Myxococcales bacterium 68-20]
MVTRIRILLTGVSLALASGACVAVFGMDPLSERAATDAGADDVATADAPDEAAGACGVDRIGEVGRPLESPRTEDGGTVLFALSSLDLGINPAEGPPGFDLDRRVTSDLATSSCALPDAGDPRALLRSVGDPPSGVDNTTFALVQLLRSYVAAFDPTRIDLRLRTGYFGLVFRIDGWNGAKNDDDVSVMAFPTIGYWRVLDAGVPEWNGESTRPFDRDAGDLLMPDDRFRAATIGSTLRSAEAWINDGRLVARFDRLMLPIRSSVDDLRTFDFDLRDAWVAATVSFGNSDVGASLSDGVIGGRVSASSLLTQISLVYDEQSGTHICSGVVGTANILCDARDIRLSHCDDGRALRCDGLSFGARFDAYHLDQLGPFRGRYDADFRAKGQVPPSERCPDAGNEPALDCPQ